MDIEKYFESEEYGSLIAEFLEDLIMDQPEWVRRRIWFMINEPGELGKEVGSVVGKLFAESEDDADLTHRYHIVIMGYWHKFEPHPAWDAQFPIGGNE